MGVTLSGIVGQLCGELGSCCCYVASVVSDSVQPHRWKPTRLPRPWDSPGKNTGVGCHFLLQCMKMKCESEAAQSCPTLWSHGPQPTRLLRPWDFPGKSTGVGCHCLLWRLAGMDLYQSGETALLAAGSESTIIITLSYSVTDSRRCKE